MNAAENNLIQSLTGETLLHKVKVTQLEEIVSKYPYYSLAQLLLAKKYKLEGHQNFTSHLQHCTLFYQDIPWLQSRLYSKAAIADNTIETNAGKDVFETETGAINKEAHSVLTKNDEIENANLITLPAEDVLGDFTLQINDVKDEPELPPLDEEELTYTDDDTLAEVSAKIADVLQHQVEDFNAPVEEESNLPISTEPYHTIDYFASQGIKADIQLQDAFAKKVHTFTDWLKHMKRINNYPIDLGSDPDMESFVQSIADTSNQAKAVDTEAMAEVLVKQGKFEKAIEVYQKLSLHNPDKTAYFAAKINQLKA